MNGYGRSGIGNGVSLKLSFPTWSTCAGVKEQNDAMMVAPWLNLCESNGITESLQAKQ